MGMTVTVGEEGGEIFCMKWEVILHSPSGLVPLSVAAFHLARLRRCAGCEDRGQVSPRCAEVLPEPRARAIMQPVCFVSALTVQMRNASLLSSSLLLSIFFHSMCF